MSDKSKTRTITLSDSAPVIVSDATWPSIAYGSGDSWPADDLDHARHDQASSRGELDEWWMRVRRHADGRHIVYGRNSANWQCRAPEAGGYVIAAGQDVVACIRGLAEELNIPAACASECVADLPATVLV